MRVGNEEGMVKRGVGGPWKLDLVEGIEKQEMFEVGHLPHCSALKPQPIPPPNLCSSGVLGFSISLVAFSICPSSAERRTSGPHWNSPLCLILLIMTFVPRGAKEQCPHLAGYDPARVQGLPLCVGNISAWGPLDLWALDFRPI